MDPNVYFMQQAALLYPGNIAQQQSYVYQAQLAFQQQQRQQAALYHKRLEHTATKKTKKRPSEPTAAPNTTKESPGVQEYASRALQTVAHNPVLLDRMERALKQMIQAHSLNGTLDSTDWANKAPPKINVGGAKTAKASKTLSKTSSRISSTTLSSKRAVPSAKSVAKKKERSARFSQAAPAKKTRWTIEQADADQDWDDLIIQGTSTALEKRYLRLTMAPDPSSVRPLRVLEQALPHVLAAGRDYVWTCDQLKAIRQDLTVQHITNGFTVLVYERHARLALDNDDLNEFNQCQTQLTKLYSAGFAGSVAEFLAYRILYFLHRGMKADLSRLLGQLSDRQRAEPAIAHALSVSAAMSIGNYARFFKLYSSAPNKSRILMSHIVPGVRKQAISVMARTHRPDFPAAALGRLLGLDGQDEITAFVVQEGLTWNGTSITFK